jgi:diguanylate cyclase (GGDEF)-like protein
MNIEPDQRHSISIYHLKQHELVNFLYDRFTVGMVFTLIVAVVATVLASMELSLQGRQNWVYLWFGGILLIQFLRYQLQRRYQKTRIEDQLNHKTWKRRFVIGVYVIALWQGLGVVAAMPYISQNLQYIFHSFLLGLGAGAIAYLATSMIVFGGYLVLMILPVTLYLFWQGTPDSIVLGCMHIFMVGAYYFGVRRMNGMIADSLHFRFDNEMLVNDLQRLLKAVAESNKELNDLSTTDELTGASNFRAFRVGLENLRIKHLSRKLPLNIVILNIDYYHEYNTLYGYDIGNKTLTAVANLLSREIVQKEELVARLSGAEFAIMLPGISCEGTRVLMEKIMQQLEEMAIPHEKSRVGPHLTISVGISCLPVSEKISARDMIMTAEEALRRAKKNGRNRIEVING